MYTQNDWRFYQEYELYHHGIKGQKWGVSNGPPYPLGSAISTGKRLIGKAAGAIKRHKEKRIQAEAARLKARQEKKAQQDEETKQKTIKSGNADEVSKIASNLSIQELNEAMTRVDLQRRLDMAKNQGPSKADEALRKIKKTTEWAQTGINAWNTFAQVYNSLSEDQIPVINGQWASQQADKRRRMAEEEQRFADQQRAAAREQAIRTWSDEDIAKNQHVFSTAELKSRAERKQALGAITGEGKKNDKTNSDNTVNTKESTANNKKQESVNNYESSKPKSEPKTEAPKPEPSYREKLSSWAAETKPGQTGWLDSAEKAVRDESARAAYLDSISQYNKAVTRQTISAMAREKDMKERADAFDNLAAAWARNDDKLRHGMIYFEIFHDAFDLDAILIG